MRYCGQQLYELRLPRGPRSDFTAQLLALYDGLPIESKLNVYARDLAGGSPRLVTTTENIWVRALGCDGESLVLATDQHGDRRTEGRTVNARLAILITCLVCVAAAVSPGGAGAAVIADDNAYGLGSAQLDGGTLYWWQVNAGPDTDWDETSRILRRDLAAATVTTVFETDGDDRITAFNAVGGRLVVGVHNPRDGSSRIVEVTLTASGPTTAVLIQRTGDYSGLICTSRVRLLGVNAQSEVLVEELRRASRDANCEDGLLKRTESTITAIAPDGTTRAALERKGGWDDGSSDASTGRMTWGGGDWFIRSAGNSYEDYGSDSGPGGDGGMLNLATGQFAATDVPFDSGVSAEVSTGGHTLVNQRGRASWLRSGMQSAPARSTARRSWSPPSTSWPSTSPASPAAARSTPTPSTTRCGSPPPMRRSPAPISTPSSISSPPAATRSGNTTATDG